MPPVIITDGIFSFVSLTQGVAIVQGNDTDYVRILTLYCKNSNMSIHIVRILIILCYYEEHNL